MNKKPFRPQATLQLSARAKEMRAKGLLNTRNELMLYGVIGDWWDGMDAATIVREIEALSGDTLVVRIHSPGGYITEGLAMYNALQQSDKRVEVYIDGLCASMATVVAMAGDTIYTPDNALWMIHKPWGSIEGNADDLRQAAENLDVLQESLIAAYTGNGRVTEARIREILDSGKDYYMTGSEAVQQGFADQLTGSIKAAASIDVTGLQAPGGHYKTLFDFYAVSAASTPTEEVSIMLKKLLKMKAALLKQGVAMADITAALAAAFGVSESKIDQLINEESGEATDAQLNAGIDALNTLQPAPAPAPEPRQQPPAQDPRAAVAEERSRVAAINALAKKHALPDEQRDGLINNGQTLEEARAQTLDWLAQSDRSRQPSLGFRMTDTSADLFHESAANAMLNRMQPGNYKLDDGGRDFRGMSLIEMAAASLNRVGISTRGMSKREIAAKAMMTTSDFPEIVADVANKVIIATYNAQPRTFMAFGTQVTLSDFKARHAIEISGGSTLDVVNEDGEFKAGVLTEGKKYYSLDTYGRIFHFTRQLLINDDLGAFNTFMMGVGSQAARKETEVVYSVIKSTSGIYTSGNKNLGTGGAVSETTLSEARKLLRQQTDADGNRINVVGRHLVVNSERETEAQKLLAAVLSTQTSEVNAFANSLNLVVEPELDGVTNDPWYIFADPMLVPSIEFAYLSGEEGPYLETQTGFEVDGMKLKIRHDFGAGFVSHRGSVRNPGA